MSPVLAALILAAVILTLTLAGRWFVDAVSARITRHVDRRTP